MLPGPLPLSTISARRSSNSLSLPLAPMPLRSARTLSKQLPSAWMRPSRETSEPAIASLAISAWAVGAASAASEARLRVRRGRFKACLGELGGGAGPSRYRKSVGEGKNVSVGVDLGGVRI